MGTYLLLWNPKQWEWKDIEDYINAKKGIEKDYIRWSIGNTKKIKIGDRVFLMRLGEEPKGIIAAGTVVREPFVAEHWDDERAIMGETARYINFKIESIINLEFNS